MKAAIVEKPGVLVVRELPDPVPGDYQALCRLLFGSTCAGTDLHLIDGTFPWPVKYPAILGHESIGEVVRPGPKVRYLKSGDLITRVSAPAPPPETGIGLCWGGFAEYGIATDWQAMREDGLPEEQWRGFRTQRVLPPGTDTAAATMTITWRETLSYIDQLSVPTGGAVLIIGSGANAFSFAAHARNLGAAIVTVIGSRTRRETAMQVGATHYVDYRLENVREAAGAISPEGYDVAIDAVGRAGQPDLAVSLLKTDGTFGLYGLDNLGRLTLALGTIWKPFRYHPLTYDEASAHDAVMAYLAQGKLRAEDFLDLDHIFPLEAITAAFEYVRQRRALKALVKLT